MRILARTCLLILTAGLCAAAWAGNVYRWKDANGVTHASDRPPPGQRYETRRVAADPDAAPAQAAQQPAEDPRCTTARSNLALLDQAGTEVQQDVDGDGKPDRTLDAEERAAQRELAQAAIKAYCR
ncbi:DUF4124 domain-containing protein [Pseudoxanthomonas taiwanensis]|jgi:hypothetical protein|uniref:DUF4124 domain-containing protein n=1 Tax=Pseudoxanthomonas taiwanensis TaxID=176598 RepID=A0A921TG57_9GAMM|nr:DUF4124 domain-containing protein [Pseudoxanthomonas taiwanensis]KAF1689373.1 DUF4124 domain-containing protein [Pseudoxanthomonas taiwanensis]MBO2467754.1 DUF4124 domain-containing protein [Xanthomonadaceae bacterium]